MHALPHFQLTTDYNKALQQLVDILNKVTFLNNTIKLITPEHPLLTMKAPINNMEKQLETTTIPATKINTINDNTTTTPHIIPQDENTTPYTTAWHNIQNDTMLCTNHLIQRNMLKDNNITATKAKSGSHIIPIKPPAPTPKQKPINNKYIEC